MVWTTAGVRTPDLDVVPFGFQTYGIVVTDQFFYTLYVGDPLGDSVDRWAKRTRNPVRDPILYAQATIGRGTHTDIYGDLTVTDDRIYFMGQAGGQTDAIYACDLSGTYMPGETINIGADNRQRSGLAHRNGLLYVMNTAGSVTRYDIATKARVTGGDFDMGEGTNWRGLSFA